MITEQRLRTLMQTSTDDLLPDPELLVAARAVGIRRRRITVVGTAVAAVVALGGSAIAVAAVQNGRPEGVSTAATQVVHTGWHGNWRVGVSDPYWKTGTALTKQLRALDHAPRPAGTHADWYVYGTTNDNRFVLDSVGKRLYLSYLTIGRKDAVVVQLPLAFTTRSPLPVVVQPRALGNQYLVVLPQAALSYQLRGRGFHSVGTTAALVPENAVAIRATHGSKKSTLVLPIHLRRN